MVERSSRSEPSHPSLTRQHDQKHLDYSKMSVKRQRARAALGQGSLGAPSTFPPRGCAVVWAALSPHRGYVKGAQECEKLPACTVLALPGHVHRDTTSPSSRGAFANSKQHFQGAGRGASSAGRVNGSSATGRSRQLSSLYTHPCHHTVRRE